MTTNLQTVDHAVASRLSPGFRAGTESVDLADYTQPPPFERDVDVDGIRQFIDEAMVRFDQARKGEADAWLAPRVHYALRLTRREAAQRGVWNWLGCVLAPDYVRWRWGAAPEDGEEGKAAPLERFIGPQYKQALARLWWMAELFRNGADYSPVEIAMYNQDIPNNLFRMDIAHHRPTVQAAVGVLADKGGREANALARAMNLAATTLLIDAMAPDEPLDPQIAEQWIGAAADVDPVAFFDQRPPGPEDPIVPAASVDVMFQLLEELLAEARVRGRA